MATTAEVKGIQLQFKSPTGEVIGLLSDGDNSGSILQFTISEIAQGGVDSFSFSLPRNHTIPLSRNAECFVYINGELQFVGFISDIPEPDQDDPELVIVGSGFYKRLEKTIINRTYETTTDLDETDEDYVTYSLEDIVKDVLSNELGSDVGITYDETLIDVPVLTDLSIDFEDVTLFDALEQLMQICNYDYSNTKYRFFIDNDKKLNIAQWGDSPLKGLFEGFQYQNPEVTIDNSSIANRYLCYRTSSTDSDAVEYVDTVEDLESINNEGLFSEKLVLPYFCDDDTIRNIAQSLLERYKSPQKTIAIENYQITGPLPFGLYNLNNRRLKYWVSINDCDSLDDWDVTNMSTAVISLSSEHVLTGRQSIKCEVNSSLGDYFEYTLEEAIPLPQLLRAYVYFDSAAIQVSIEFFDADDNSTTILLGLSTSGLRVNTDVSSEEDLEVTTFGDDVTIDVDTPTTAVVNQWLVLSEMVGDETNVEDLFVTLTEGGEEEEFIVNLTTEVEEQLEVRSDTQAALLEVVKVRINILTDTIGTFYLDRLDTYADVYKQAQLLLESAEYSLSETQKTVNANFGQKGDSLLDEISEEVKDGDIALAVFAKQ